MMIIATIFKMLHVFVSFWMVSGVIGRWVALKQAENSRLMSDVMAQIKTAGQFERLMVIPGSSALIILGLATAIAGHYPLLGFLQGSPTNWLLASIILFLTIIPLIRFVFLPRGKVFERRLEEAATQGQVTPELTAAFRDPVTRAGHIYELAMIAAIIFLMVVKPF